MEVGAIPTTNATSSVLAATAGGGKVLVPCISSATEIGTTWNLLLLPEDAIKVILFFLNGTDVVNTLQTCKMLWNIGTQSSKFWIDQLHAQLPPGECADVPIASINTTSATTIQWYREQYLLYASSRSLQAVQWIQTLNDDTNTIRRTNGTAIRRTILETNTPCAREGHLSCQLFNNSCVIVTGGFTDDSVVYLKEVPTEPPPPPPPPSLPSHNFQYDDDDEDMASSAWMAIQPSIGTDAEDLVENNNETEDLDWVYGASLTTIDDNRAVRFGGFRQGGYSMESSQVVLLEVQKVEITQGKVTTVNRAGLLPHHRRQLPLYEYRASWRVQPCTFVSSEFSDDDDIDDDDEEAGNPITDGVSRSTRNSELFHEIAARAYHTSTLLFDRYLLIMGGMKSNRSIFRPILLDTRTWTWYHEGLMEEGSPRPFPRFGHSAVLDISYFNKSNSNNNTETQQQQEHGWTQKIANTEAKRTSNRSDYNLTRRKNGRIVIFGGGNGSDLLRSGVDNTEVWELNLNLDRCRTGTAGQIEPTYLLHDTLPWSWKMLHQDTRQDDRDGNNDNDDDNDDNSVNEEEVEEHIKKGVENGTIPTSNGQSIGFRKNQSTSLLSIPQRLSPSESLTIGRCHAGVRVSPDTVLFLFGSGDPSTNAVLGYDLDRDVYIRPKVLGPLPLPRFTFAYSYIASMGYVIVHGGYSTQISETTNDVCILDVAPSLRRSCTLFRVNDAAPSYQPVTDEQVQNEEESRQRLLRAAAIREYFLTMTDIQARLFGEGLTVTEDNDPVVTATTTATTTTPNNGNIDDSNSNNDTNNDGGESAGGGRNLADQVRLLLNVNSQLNNL